MRIPSHTERKQQLTLFDIPLRAETDRTTRTPKLDKAQVEAYLRSIRASNEAGCGCIPMVQYSAPPAWVITNNTSETSTPECSNSNQHTLDGYISLKKALPIYKSDIEASYKSTRTGRERNYESLKRFIEEATELLGEGKTKKNVIFEGLKAKPQVLLQLLLAAYERLTFAHLAMAGRVGIQNEASKIDFKKKSYFQSVWGTLLDLRTNDNLIDNSKLLAAINETREDQVIKVREGLSKNNNGTYKVALALWIAREKAKIRS